MRLYTANFSVGNLLYILMMFYKSYDNNLFQICIFSSTLKCSLVNSAPWRMMLKKDRLEKKLMKHFEFETSLKLMLNLSDTL